MSRLGFTDASHESLPAIIVITASMVVLAVVGIIYCLVGMRGQEDRRVAQVYQEKATDDREHQAFFREMHEGSPDPEQKDLTHSNDRPPGQPLTRHGFPEGADLQFGSRR